MVLLLSACSNVGIYGLLFNEEDVDQRYIGYLPSEGIKKPVTVTGSVYSGLVVTDIHMGSYDLKQSEENDFLLLMDRLFKNENKEYVPRFIICLGDIADGGHEEEYKEYNAFFKLVKELAVKNGVVSSASDFMIYSELGNHDLYNNGWGSWKRNVYPHIASYYFNLRSDSQTMGFSYYFLDTGNGAFGRSQLDNLEKLFKNDPRPKIISTHYPVYTNGTEILTLSDTSERNYMLSLFSKYNVKKVFAGHEHLNFSCSFNNFDQENTAALFLNRSCRLFTVNEKAQTVHTKLIIY